MDSKFNVIYYDYKVKPGDSLSTIMHKMYGQIPGGTGYRESLEYVLGINPQVKNPNLIYPGQVIHLGVIPPPTESVARTILAPALPRPGSSPVSRVNGTSAVDKVSRQDEDYFWALSWLEHHAPGLVIPGTVAAGAASNLLSPGNTRLVRDVADLYSEFKQGRITRGQYDYLRLSKLNGLRKNLGPMEKVLFGGKTSRESIRIARGGGIPATSYIHKHFSRLNGIAKMGKYGGIVLTGVGVTASCMKIANTNDRKEKNEIFVETVVSAVLGSGAGYLVGLFLISNPIGWGTALVLATGTVALSYAGGKVGRIAYDTSGTRVDFVNGLGVDRICN